MSATIFSKEEFEYSQPPQYPGFQTIFFSHRYWSFVAKPRQRGAQAERQETGALSNRKHSLFHIRYFENGSLEPGYLHKRPPLHNSHISQSIYWLQFNPLYNGMRHYSASPTAKITSRKQPVFQRLTNEIRNGHDIWSVWCVDDCGNRFNCVLFNTPAVSIDCLKYL